MLQTSVNGPHHVDDEFIDAVGFLDLRDQGGNATLVITTCEVGKDELLEAVDLILQSHEVGDGFVAFVWVMDAFEGYILFVLEQPVEFFVVAVKSELGHDQADVSSNERTIA